MIRVATQREKYIEENSTEMENTDQGMVAELKGEIIMTIEKDNGNEIEISRAPLKKINENRKATLIIQKGNDVIKEIQEHYTSVTNINKLVYETALCIQNTLIPPDSLKNKRTRTFQEPPWKKQIQKRNNIQHQMFE